MVQICNHNASRHATRRVRCERSPSGRFSEGADGIGELTANKIGMLQLLPPMSPWALIRGTAKSTCQIVGRRVDGTNWDFVASETKRQLQIGIVRDHDRSLDCASEHIMKEMRCDVHIGPLLFSLSDGRQEMIIRRSAKRKPGVPAFVADLVQRRCRSPTRVGGQGGLLGPGVVASLFYEVDRASKFQSRQVDGLVEACLGVVGLAYTGGAIDDTIDGCVGPSCEGLDELPHVKPSPAGRSPAANGPTAVIEVETIDVYANPQNNPRSLNALPIAFCCKASASEHIAHDGLARLPLSRR